MNLSKFYVLFALCQKSKLRFYQDSKAWFSFCFVKLKVLNESKFPMPWVRCAFGNVSFCRTIFFWFHALINTSVALASLGICLSFDKTCFGVFCLILPIVSSMAGSHILEDRQALYQLTNQQHDRFFCSVSLFTLFLCSDVCTSR